ncbi:hypothetical protein D9M68_597660 [compost metagenome]
MAGELAEGGLGVEQVPDHLVQQAEAGQFAQQQAHGGFVGGGFAGEVADPGWVEAALFQQRPEAFLQAFVFRAELDLMIRQVQPGAAAVDGAAGELAFQQGDEYLAFQLRQGVTAQAVAVGAEFVGLVFVEALQRL